MISVLQLPWQQLSCVASDRGGRGWMLGSGHGTHPQCWQCGLWTRCVAAFQLWWYLCEYILVSLCSFFVCVLWACWIANWEHENQHTACYCWYNKKAFSLDVSMMSIWTQFYVLFLSCTTKAGGIRKTSWVRCSTLQNHFPLLYCCYRAQQLISFQCSCRFSGDWKQGYVHQEMDIGTGGLGEQQSGCSLQFCSVLQSHREGPRERHQQYVCFSKWQTDSNRFSGQNS